jgi:hypothetical protein
MIRFLPDDWLDVVMRPLDMMSPEANMYVEISAPDVRLAAALLLAAIVAGLWLWRRRGTPTRPVVGLTVLLMASMAPWLATTGNGRYFIAWLILLGPLCAGWARALPITPGKKVSIVAGLIGVQLFMLSEEPPWASWTWTNWEEPPYFQMDQPPADPATYVMIASPSYSLVVPQFPAESTWINLAGDIERRDAPEVAKRLSAARPLRLFIPVIPSQVLKNRQPTAAWIEAVGTLLEPHGLRFVAGSQCTFLHSDGLTKIGLKYGGRRLAEESWKFGFWICPLEYHAPAATAPPPTETDAAVDAVFEAVERLCPRFFPSHAGMRRLNDGWLKHYDTDTTVYVLDDGTAMYKYWRSINPVVIGKREDLLAGRVTIDCSKIRAGNWRRGGP